MKVIVTDSMDFSSSNLTSCMDTNGRKQVGCQPIYWNNEPKNKFVHRHLFMMKYMTTLWMCPLSSKSCYQTMLTALHTFVRW